MSRTCLLRVFFLLSWMAWSPVHAAAVEVPEALRDWQQWVLKDKEYRDCPFYFDRSATGRDDFVCTWPGSLELTVDADGAHFEQTWTLYADEQWLPLPGDSKVWPERVTANGRPAQLVMHGARPSLRLGPGSHRITGRFAWDERPGILALPVRSGLLSLRVDGQSIAHPVRTSQGIFLGEEQQGSREQNAVRTEIHRLVSDNVPTRLTTVMSVDVSGEVREELFGPLLPEGFVPLAIDSELPARFEADGKLRLQVWPGEWTIAVEARAADVLDAIGLGVAEVNLPDSEVWSYRANVSQRVTNAEGLPTVYPDQAGVPDGWRQLPAFRILPGEQFRIVERSRGIGAADNDLALYREMWLDFEGSGFLAADSIRGLMRRGWRLDMAPPYRLLSASEGGEELLITLGAEEGDTGVELRDPDTDVQSLAEIATRGEMPVTGWNARFGAVDIGLNLPPGYKLLGAPGADRAHTSWASRWRLLDFFLISIVTVGAWRLLGPAAGIVALLALVLSYQEADASAWLWLNLLVAMALLRVAPAGRLRKSALAYRAVSAVVLVLWLVPFVADQLRITIHPQLEPQADAWVEESFLAMSPGYDALKTAPMVSQAEPMSLLRSQALPAAIEEAAATASPMKHYARYQPNAMVQTGPGIPAWRWNRHELHWGGPVDAGQTMRLLIAPRWLVAALRVLEVFMLLAFAALLAGEVFNRRLTLPGGFRVGGATAGIFLAVALAGVLPGAASPAHADIPGPQLLGELEKRLLEPPGCTPRCAEIVMARVNVADDAVQMHLEVHALADVGLPLPGSEAGWRPGAILLGGSAAGEVLREPDGTLWAHVQAGRHAIELSGPIPAADSLEIPFPAPPRVIEANADGWRLSGIENRSLLSGSLQLTRTRTTDSDDSGAPRWESSRFPTFVRIERELEFDLDWRVTTKVTRIAPAEGALTLNVGLIAGESVTTPDLTSDGGKLLVSMESTVDSVSWESYLPRQSPLVIEAEPGQPWREVWRAAVGGIWHAEFTGVPPSIDSGGAAGMHVAEFHPRPGERLQLNVTRPEPSAGETLAFDAVALEVDHGKLSSTSSITLEYRSTRGAQHLLRLPGGAEVRSLRIDGEHEPFQADGGELSLPILPGEHAIELSWRTQGELAWRAASPTVDLGAPAGNIRLQMHLPDNRWLLATRGPSLGPAVLYWGELVVLVLFALILGRVGLSPLRTRHWLLLGVGLSTFNWPVLGLVTAWLLICGARERWRAGLPARLFNGVQILIATMTVLALAALVTTLPMGLLGTPDMHVAGIGSWGNSLNWFADHSDSLLPVASAWSVPLWIYKALILAWALWLSFALLRWLPWVWQCFSAEGLWRRAETSSPTNS